jgi:hypothetical protein
MRRMSIVLAICVAVCIVANLTGRQRSFQRADNLLFHALSDLTQPGDVMPTLRGGREATYADWPATFVATYEGIPCTGTLLGPHALLTAAHCVPSGGTTMISLQGTVYSGQCTDYPTYPADLSSDWAMCVMNIAVPVQTFERVNIDNSLLTVGTEILLTGFGCTTAKGTGGDDNVYRIGEAAIDTPPSGNVIHTNGEVAICFGDSGGPAFLYLDVSQTRRVEVAVNSEAVRDTSGQLDEESFLASLSATEAKQFLTKWMAGSGAAICGMVVGMPQCHQ